VKRKALLLVSAVMLLMSPALMAKSSIFVLITDLYNQKSVKPQEQGSMLKFPEGSITTDGKLIEVTVNSDANWMEKESDPETATKNPIPATPESLANGELKYNTYCAVCHTSSTDTNDQGLAKSKVNEKGMIAPAMLALTPMFTDGYIYNKAKYASGIVMPPLGYATTEKDRWDIINYIRTKLEKQQ